MLIDKEKKTKIAIMTSGGDAPGMNSVINFLCKYASPKYDLVLIKNAFYGLVNDKFLAVDFNQLRFFKHISGTLIGSLRFTQFEKIEFQRKAVENLKKHGVDVLIVVGGNGSYEGARCLARLGIKVICIPATIDNDVSSTDLAIGFPTALETVHRYLLNVSATAWSHSRISLVEVMGRYCADLANFSALSSFADVVSTRDCYVSPEKMVNLLQEKLKTKNSALIVVSEHLYGDDGRPTLAEVGKFIEEHLQKKVNIGVIGYSQRGGEPCVLDCVLAGMMSFYAIELVERNVFNQMIGYLGGKVTSVPIEQKMVKKQSKFFAKMIHDYH